MSIEDKLTTIAENTPKVYNKGYENGKNSVFPIDRYASMLRFNTFNVFGTRDVVLNLDNILHLNSLIAITATSAEEIAAYTNNTVEHLTINAINQPKQASDMLKCEDLCADKKLKRVTLNFDTQFSSISGMFYNMQALEVIDGTPLDFSKITYSATPFHNLYMLKEVRLKGVINFNLDMPQCPCLSNESIQSIIDCLADLTGSKAKRLDFHADIVKKLTDEQLTQISNKNWSVI